MKTGEDKEGSLETKMCLKITAIKIHTHKSQILLPYMEAHTRSGTHSISSMSYSYPSLFCLTEPVSSLSDSRLFLLWQRSRGREGRLKKKKSAEKAKDEEILTGICYSHRHHAASEREGALLV